MGPDASRSAGNESEEGLRRQTSCSLEVMVGGRRLDDLEDMDSQTRFVTQ